MNCNIPKPVVGSDDPEMWEIKQVFNTVDIHYINGECCGERVNPRTAYDLRGDFDSGYYMFIECFPQRKPRYDYIVVDHHGKNDPVIEIDGVYNYPGKFGLKNAHKVSSLGQIVNHIYSGTFGTSSLELFKNIKFDDLIHNFDFLKEKTDNPQELLNFIGAIDHCGNSLINFGFGKFNGDDVFYTKLRQISIGSDYSIDFIHKIFDEYSEDILKKPLNNYNIVDLDYSFSPGYSVDYLVTQLIGSYYQIPIQINHTEVDGVQKIVLTGFANPEMVSSWMIRSKEQGYGGIYGVPIRGYAGCYFTL